MVLKQGQRTKGRGAFIRSLKCFKTESAKWGKHLENDLLGPSPPHYNCKIQCISPTTKETGNKSKIFFCSVVGVKMQF